MRKIVVLDGNTLNPGDLTWDRIGKSGNLTIYPRTGNETEKVVEAIGNAEIIFTNKTLLTKEVLDRVPSVKYIGVLATGYNVVDLAAAKENGMVVTNIPDYSTNAVAQFTFALLLEICHHVGDHNALVKEGEWTSSLDFSFWKYPLIELSGKTMGLIGFGKIGQATAKIAEAFGLKILMYYRHRNLLLESAGRKYVSLDDLLAESDIISLHCPLTEATKGIINRSSIARMKDGVMIINTSRGQLVVEEDLKAALLSGKVAAAAVDVVSNEPVNSENPLLKAKNCIITPHIAWASKESRIRLMNMAADNLESFLKGIPVNVVN